MKHAFVDQINIATLWRLVAGARSATAIWHFDPLSPSAHAALRLCRRMGLRKITAGAVVENAPSLAVLKKLGFMVEGTLRQQMLVDGEYQDVIWLGLLREEFRSAF